MYYSKTVHDNKLYKIKQKSQFMLSIQMTIINIYCCTFTSINDSIIAPTENEFFQLDKNLLRN